MKVKNLITFSILLFLLMSCRNQSVNNEDNSTNWSIFRGNPALTGHTNVSLPNNPVLLWTFQSGSNTRSSPVVYNQVAYWSDRRGRIFGVDINGEQVFDFNMNTAVDAIPMVHNNVLYIGRIDGFLYAICLEKQVVLWTFEAQGQIGASPNRMIFDGKDAIIVGCFDSYLYVLNSKTGEEIARFESGDRINGAVAQNNNILVYGGCDGWIRVIDASSGRQTDSLHVGMYIPGSPAMIGNFVYIADHDGNVFELRLNRGQIASHRKIFEPRDDNRRHTSVPAVTDNILYILSDDRHVYAINRSDGSIVWSYLLRGDTSESSPVVANDRLLVYTRNGIVTILDAQTGRLVWDYDIGEQIFASPAVINGHFYVLTSRGNLFAFGNR
ncbi:MAG: PQQ-binding-like beta-propeller repeat protein [Bacteroidales bacterium]|nr:PQQ-binding-like beta-propeller repeat protein [Bacteroidales bacterium]